MTVPERTPIAMEYSLNGTRIAALIELYLGHEPTFHHSTREALIGRRLVSQDVRGVHLTEKGREVAAALLKADDQEPEPTTGLNEDEAEPTIIAESDDEDESEESTTAHVTRSALPAAILQARYSVALKARNSGCKPTWLAVVVGTEEQAQQVADQWNLDHLPQIAANAASSYAVVEPIELVDGLPVFVFGLPEKQQAE